MESDEAQIRQLITTWMGTTEARHANLLTPVVASTPGQQQP